MMDRINGTMNGLNEWDLSERLLSIEKAAEFLSISPWTIRKMITNRKIASVKLGSRRLIPMAEVRRLINDSMQTPVAQ